LTFFVEFPNAVLMISKETLPNGCVGVLRRDVFFCDAEPLSCLFPRCTALHAHKGLLLFLSLSLYRSDFQRENEEEEEEIRSTNRLPEGNKKLRRGGNNGLADCVPQKVVAGQIVL
jgi:hypothetical protein